MAKFINVQPSSPTDTQKQIQKQAASAKSVNADIDCPLCKKQIPLQLKLEKGVPDTAGRIAYPKGDTVTCPQCQKQVNLAAVKNELERQMGREVILS